MPFQKKGVQITKSKVDLIDGKDDNNNINNNQRNTMVINQMMKPIKVKIYTPGLCILLQRIYVFCTCQQIVTGDFREQNSFEFNSKINPSVVISINNKSVHGQAVFFDQRRQIMQK